MMEILIAMVLLSVVGAIALSSFSNTGKMTQVNDNIAMNIARGYLEQLYEYVREDYRSLSGIPLAVNSPRFPPSPANAAQPATQTLDGVTYTTNYTVTSVDPNGDGQEDYRRVTMTVTW